MLRALELLGLSIILLVGIPPVVICGPCVIGVGLCCIGNPEPSLVSKL